MLETSYFDIFCNGETNFSNFKVFPYFHMDPLHIFLNRLLIEDKTFSIYFQSLPLVVFDIAQRVVDRTSSLQTTMNALGLEIGLQIKKIFSNKFLYGDVISTPRSQLLHGCNGFKYTFQMCLYEFDFRGSWTKAILQNLFPLDRFRENF